MSVTGTFLLLSIFPAAAASPSAAAQRGEKDLTVMVFKNAKNDLEPFGLLDMNEMELAGSSERVNVVVEFGRLKPAAAEDRGGGWAGVRRYFILKDADASAINSRVVWERAWADMGDWRELADFVTWSKTNYPAKKYLLVIWNHGNGWKKSAAGGTAQKGISFDDETGNHISTPELAQALAAAGRVDVLAFDACLMQTAEVAYEVRRFADIVVGSEETDAILAGFNENPSMSAEELGKTIVAAYRARNEEFYMDTTQSAVRTGALDGLRKRLDAWVGAAAASGEPLVIKKALMAAHGFYEIDQKDMADFFRVVMKYAAGAGLKASSGEVLRWLENDVVAANGVSGYNHRPAGGLAFYAAPGNSYNEDYNELAWSRDGLWDDFISGKVPLADGGGN